MKIALIEDDAVVSDTLTRSLEQAGFEVQGNLKGVGRKFGKSLDLVFMVKSL